MAEPSLQADAQRALAFGEQRFLAGDVAGAKQWAEYALYLAPGLPGAEQALVAYDVHSAAEAEVGPGLGGAPDWYAVLCLPRPQRQLSSSGGVLLDITYDTIKRQHRRLCLLVHPDKNPSAAADGACKLVQAAYDALSAIYLAPDRSTPTWEEELLRFWQGAANDVTPPPPAPKQPPIARPTPGASPPAADVVTPPPPPAAPKQSPIARPTPCRASPPAGSGQTALLLAAAPGQSSGSQPLPCRAAPTPGTPERPPHGQSCPLLPYCLFCRSTAGLMEGFSCFGA